MSHPGLSSTLVCPETHQPLAEAEPELLDQVNALISQGSLCDRAGSPVSEPIREALVREDRQLLFPVLDGIPMMIVDEAIPLQKVS